MRLVAILAGAALIAALSLVAAPGSAGSRAPSRPYGVDPAVLQPLPLPAPSARDRSTVPVDEHVPVLYEAGDSLEALAQPDVEPPNRPPAAQPAPVPGEVVVVPGIASWYDNGTTAMRLARGTRVRVCGQGGCVVRTINDYGPDRSIHPDRVVDLMPRDFVAVCGCSLWTGLTEVEVEILE